MGKDYRIGLIVGSILAGFALVWVATRPGLTLQPPSAPSAQEDPPDSAKTDDRGRLPDTSPEPRAARPAPTEPARVAGKGSPAPTARDANVPAKTTRVHIVRSGETLSAIAQQYYGSSNAWRKILDANKTIKDANKIAPGTKLVIPE